MTNENAERSFPGFVVSPRRGLITFQSINQFCSTPPIRMPLIDKVLTIPIVLQQFFGEDRYFSHVLFTSLILHFLIAGVYSNGLRWQLIPIYTAFIAYVLGAQWCSISLGLIGLLLEIVFRLPVVKFIAGPHSVGCVHYERKTGSSSSLPAIGAIFYPAQHPHSSSSPYFFLGDRHKLTRKLVKIWGSLLPLPSWILSHWAHVNCPVAMGVAALEEKMPVVVFCHGLAASREMYTSLALSVASNGALVLMVEHTDGSCVSARFADGSTLDLKSFVFADTDIEISTRQEQNRVRVSNLTDALNLLCDLNDGSLHVSEVMVGDKSEAGDCPCFTGRLQMDNLSLGGHSFGGATVLGFTGLLPTSGDPAFTSIRARIHVGACFLLDPALDWVPREARLAVGLGLKPGIEHYWSADQGEPLPIVPRTTNMLCMCSEEWVAFKPEWTSYGTQLFATEQAAPGSHYLAIKGAGHIALCDLPTFLPHQVNVRVLKSVLPHSDAQKVLLTVNTVVTYWLRNVKMIDGTGGSLQTIEGTYNHVFRTE